MDYSSSGAGVNILPNVRIRYPGTIIGHREESLSAQNADTDFFQTCNKMTKKKFKTTISTHQK